MPFRQNLWFVDFTVPVSLADFFADFIGETAVSVTVLAPPRCNEAKIEAIYDAQPNTSDLTTKLFLLATSVGAAVPEISVRAAPKLDWLKKVAEDFPPLQIGRWTVHDAAHRDKIKNRLFALQIDATNAFGTGEHPTTRGCLLVLDKLLKNGFRPQKTADIGCGSAVLAMGCVQASRSQAVAIDLDPDAVRIAQNNVRMNGLGPFVRVGRGSGYFSPLVRQAAPYDLIMSNIFAGPLCQLAKDLKSNLAQGGIAILSGLLTSQSKKVAAAHRAQGLSLIEHMVLGEWSVLALKKEAEATTWTCTENEA